MSDRRLGHFLDMSEKCPDIFWSEDMKLLWGDPETREACEEEVSDALASYVHFLEADYLRVIHEKTQLRHKLEERG